MQQGLFRQTALERLSSPDQLDQLMRLTDPKGWLALAVLGALTLAVVLWSIFGSVATTVHGDGLVIRAGGTSNVHARTTGRVSELKVRRGDVLSVGQLIATLEPEAGGTGQVTSPLESAQVVEVLVSRQEWLTPNTPVLNVEILDEEVRGLLYLPATVAAQVQPGMPVQLSPAGVAREEFGFIMGRVRSVAQFPSTQRGMTAVLENDSLVQHFLGATRGPPVEIEVELMRDQTPSGLKWSTSSGPPVPIPSGTLSQADIVLSEQRPISLVLPLFR
jgi:multidrug efflux pump subunit AcrA (membrane-fusion protein)